MTSPPSGRSGPRVDAITFDYWNTLVYEDRGQLRDRRVEAWLGILEGEGFAVERQRLDAAFASTWERFLVAWQTGDRQYTHVDAAVDVLEHLGYDVAPDVHEQLIESFSRTGDRAELHLTEGLEDCLHRLKAAGIRIGIVCDVGMTPSPTLRGFLAQSGVLDLFDHWSFSDEVGVYKPSPKIFDHALMGLGGVPPERAAHIGDLRRTDVAGALGMGMLALRYTGVFDDAEFDGPDADHVIASHRELAGVLGL